jgi:hypothetical protein
VVSLLGDEVLVDLNTTSRVRFEGSPSFMECEPSIFTPSYHLKRFRF